MFIDLPKSERNGNISINILLNDNFIEKMYATFIITVILLYYILIINYFEVNGSLYLK